jgi:hypothetical protein
MPEVMQSIVCPYCNEANEIMWPDDGSVAAQPIQQFLEAEELRRRAQTQAAGRITTHSGKDESQIASDYAKAFLRDACSPQDGLTAPVDPSDLKSVWNKQRELIAQYGGQQMVIAPSIFSDVCTPGANVTAVWYRVGILQMLDKAVNLLPANMPPDVQDAVLRVVARFPMKPMEIGVVYEGLPLDVEGFMKQLEQEVIERP